MMNRKEFYEYVKDNVKEYLPESYKDAEIKLQEVEKNNGLKLTGITIPNGDQRIVPTVYLDSLYQEYIHGKDVDGSWWWWPYSVESQKGEVGRSNGCGKCAWASGVFAVMYITQFLGIRHNGIYNETQVSPMKFLGRFRWENIPFAGGIAIEREE